MKLLAVVIPLYIYHYLAAPKAATLSSVPEPVDEDKKITPGKDGVCKLSLSYRIRHGLFPP